MTGRRQEVLATLRSSRSPMSIAELARHLGLHPNTVRFHLQVLVDSGRVDRFARTSTTPGRPPLMFHARPGMDPAGPRSYQLLAGALASHLSADEKSQEEAIDAGRAWGSRLAGATSGEPVIDEDQATERLTEILDDLGFSPERRSTAGEIQIGLRNCPFLDLIPGNERVICPVHLGLMQGVLTTLGAKGTVDRLDPFVEPDLCLAYVTPASRAS
jgi:predicted ArsR family transcriptional regulator